MDDPNTASVKFDPFLTRDARQPPAADAFKGQRAPVESDPLLNKNGGRREMPGEAKLPIVPQACCMFAQGVVSAVALGLSFAETGHKSGYEEGHLDASDRNAGCEHVFYWVMAQAVLDAVITCVFCMFIVSPMRQEPVGLHGCCAALRLCTLAGGFHILYFSGLDRGMCDSFLITWALILVWLGVVLLLLICVMLTCMLLGVASSEYGAMAPPKAVVMAPPMKTVKVHT